MTILNILKRNRSDVYNCLLMLFISADAEQSKRLNLGYRLFGPKIAFQIISYKHVV